MPLFKAWNTSRTIKKFIMADNLESLIEKGRSKLGLTNDGEYKVFDERDGTEIDEDECLIEYGKLGTALVVGIQWEPATPTVAATIVPTTPETKIIPTPLATTIFTPVATTVSSPFASTFATTSPTTVPMTSSPTTVSSQDSSILSQSLLESSQDNDPDLSGVFDFDYGIADDLSLSTTSAASSEEKPRPVNLTSGGSAGESSDISIVGERKRSTPKRSIFEDLLTERKKSKKDDEQLQHEQSSAFSKLMGDSYRHARQKGLKIYEKKEIDASKSDLEKMRRQFWNEKCEQLCTHSETANQGKYAVTGIVDVAWTLRKTKFLEEECKKLEKDEHEMFSNEECVLSTSLPGRGKQKSSTIPHNMQRMKLATDNFLKVDTDMATCKEKLQNADAIEKNKLIKQLDELKTRLDGTYTELKRAQEALSKSLKQKRDALNLRLKNKNN